MKTIHVAAAVIVHDRKVLACQRGYGYYKGWWEFPGGKIEAGESPEEALERECREELDCRIQIERLLETVEYDYPQFHLVMDCFLCSLLEKPKLLEHLSAKWLDAQDLFSVRWLEADLSVLNHLKTIL